MFLIRWLLGRYAERRRCIFHYRDGRRWRRADPIAAGARLEEVCPNYLDLLNTLNMAEADAPPGPVRDSVAGQKRDAATKLAAAACDVFGLAPLSDSGGVTRAEAINVLAEYFLFMERAARAAQLFPDSPGRASASPPASLTSRIAASGGAAS